ncbi:hypothetical protein L1987_16937 [Smallanthus sonchifolius]|uniref:Uncharacterized protein n=1 Tax=Smallanthus sonchifolius TaxID=185202 RepID=A0ACB9IXI1_9ASTR|nr:hypothetical protein L1987_16937 [Smallanthus sonchifolius]
MCCDLANLVYPLSDQIVPILEVYNLHVAPRASLKQQSDEEASPNARARSDPLPSSVAVQPSVPFQWPFLCLIDGYRSFNCFCLTSP